MDDFPGVWTAARDAGVLRPDAIGAAAGSDRADRVVLLRHPGLGPERRDPLRLDADETGP
jgi:hypothetical protein